jgi:hypothetical protein
LGISGQNFKIRTRQETKYVAPGQCRSVCTMVVRPSTKEEADGTCVLVCGEDDPHDTDDFVEPDSSLVEEILAQQRDPFVDLAKEDIRRLFASEPDSVFYQRQLQVMFEANYFHWITVRALAELVKEGVIAADVLPLLATGTSLGIITFYRAKRNRYWRRGAREIGKLVSRFSDPSFTDSLGSHGEMMFDAALPTAGFMPTAWKVRSYKGVDWTQTHHDLDRVFERDGVAYGAEIKNTLSYIDREEMEIKAAMCKHLGLVPLFIVRNAPKNYVFDVAAMGGFTLIFKYQLYPHGQKAFAKEVRDRLRLPTDSPARIESGTVKRLLDWHFKSQK